MMAVLMENTLEAKKLKILKRLQATVESANSIIYEINQDLEGIIKENQLLERMSDVYNLWASKE